MGALLNKLWDFALKVNPVLLVGAITVFGVFGLSAMVEYNQSDNFCQKCHAVRGPFVAVNLESRSHKPFKDNQIGCMECHRDKDFYDWAGRTAAAFGRVVQDYTNPEAVRYEVPESEDDARCLRCHYKILEDNDMKLLELSGKLKLIGLRFEHDRHYAIRSYDQKEQERLEALSSSSGGDLTDEEAEEKEFLLKVRYSNCAICHEPNKSTADGERFVDKTVNYFTSNPMTCHSCHKDAIPRAHPGKKLSLPTEESCRWCHNGRLHGMISFFNADKNDRDRTACVKCHPDYKPEMDRALGLAPMISAEGIQ